MSAVNKRLLDFLKSGNSPFTTAQISSKLDLPRTDIVFLMAQLEERGYVRIAPLYPGVDIVAPLERFLDLSADEIESLARELKSKND